MDLTKYIGTGRIVVTRHGREMQPMIVRRTFSPAVAMVDLVDDRGHVQGPAGLSTVEITAIRMADEAAG